MKEKVKCKKCKLLIDKDSKTCPYCGYDQSLEPEDKVEIKSKTLKSQSLDNITFYRQGGAFSLSLKKHIYLLVVNLIGMELIVLLISLIFKATGANETLGEVKANSLLPLIAYPILLIALCLSLWKDFIPVVKTFKYWKSILIGLGFAGLTIAFNMAYNQILQLAGVTTNDNQQAVESGISFFPVASVLVLGLIGPMCEELAYRVGLYGLIRKKNFWVALVVSSLIFGLIHFNFLIDSKEKLITELINLPSYIISGAILCCAYEFSGLAGSYTAHAVNNLIATILIIVQ